MVKGGGKKINDLLHKQLQDIQSGPQTFWVGLAPG